MSINKRFLWAWPIVLGPMLFVSPVMAQDAAADEGTVEEITVTGSRIKRDEFSSPSPIQVLDVNAGRKLGISSISDLIQRSSVSNGAQIDASINTAATNFNATEAPPTGGVGSTAVNLRGLGPERTLVLLNGRRMGSTGVRGAPNQPDISMIPFSMVERVEILTEGVSAVYGADAVAGVVNVIMRDEFEGFEVMVNTEQPVDNGGEVGQIGMIMGVVSDVGSFQFAAEVFDRTRIRTGDRDFARCFRDIDVREDGSIEDICRSGFFDNNGFDENFDIWLYTPGETNGGVPNWSNSAVGDVLPWNPTNDLVADPGPGGRWPYDDFYNDQDERRNSDLISELERFSLVSSGKLSLDWWSNEEIFFETMYLNNRTFSKAGTEQIFPDLLGTIPQLDVNGNVIVTDVDMNWAADQLDDNEFLSDGTTANPQFGQCDPNAADGFAAGQNVPASAFPCAGVLELGAGQPILVDNPLNPFPGDFTPIITMDSFAQERLVERAQSRFVLGLRGDLGDSSWSYEGYFSYDRGIGFQSQKILLEPHFEAAIHDIRLNSDGEVICGNSGNTSSIGFGFITAENCVPWDFNNADNFTGGPTGEGTFTQEETDFFIGNRTNRTVVEQKMWSVFATGDLFEMGGRTVAAAVGAEFREDTIASQNDIVGVLALNAAENPLQEGETNGSRDLTEVFGEISIPLMDSLTFDGAIRYTDESNFGEETTYRVRLEWRPLDYLAFSGTFGTSFRAPNLREQFLADQFGGVGGNLDPCINNNIQQLIANTNGDDDPITVNAVNNCIAQGVEFTDSDGNGFPDVTVMGASGVTTIPISTGGNADLKAETSETTTFTVKFSQPWADSFDLDIALSFFDIVINDTVAQPETSFILNGCILDINFPDQTSPFCTLMTRNLSAGATSAFVNSVDVSFVNIGEETAQGFDLNTRVSFALGDSGWDFVWATVTTKLLEREIETFDASDRDDNLGEIGFNEIKFASTLGVTFKNWEFYMQNRFLSEGQQDNSQAMVPGVGRFSADGMGSRDVDFIDDTWYTDISATYGTDTWAATLGVSNLFDEPPPLIHSFGGPNRNNAVSSAGYDFYGQTYFFTATVAF